MINVTRFSRGLPGGYLSSDMSDSPIGILPLLRLLFLWGLGSCARGVLPTHPNEGHTGPEIQPMLLRGPCSQAGGCTHPGKGVLSLVFARRPCMGWQGCHLTALWPGTMKCSNTFSLCHCPVPCPVCGHGNPSATRTNRKGVVSLWDQTRGQIKEQGRDSCKPVQAWKSLARG